MRKCFVLVFALAVIVAFSGCARRKRYENPIATDSAQPDKTLFDRAVSDLERSRYEVARLTLQTMINTYPDSEYLAKAKLAIADSWFRQGGTSGLAQAEAEYKDFITFFPGMEEAVEAQMKVAMIHYQQMTKPDRDNTHAHRAENEFKQLLVQFPDSKFTEEARQRLREVQEVVAEGEFRVGRFYYIKGSNRAAVLRLKDLTDHYPYYSQADSALWMLGQSFERGGKEFRDQAASAYERIVKDYPLGDHVDDAKAKLKDWKKPIPPPDPEQELRMKFEREHRDTPGIVGRSMGILKTRPDVSMAAKTGDPLLVNVPGPPPLPERTATGTGGGTVAIQQVDGPPPNVPAITPGAKPKPEPDPAKPPADSASTTTAATSTNGKAAASATASTPAAATADDTKESSSKKKKGILRKMLRLPGGDKDKKKNP